MSAIESTAFIKPPTKIPLLIKLGIIISNKVTKKELLAPKLLAWYPKVAFSSGVLESLVAHGDKDLNKRILKLVRVQVSITAACPFCVDMNSFEYEKEGVTEAEILSLVKRINPDEVETFSPKERLALKYALMITQTPVEVPESFVETLKTKFTEREIVILASTAAQVNYWARLLKSLGVPPAGFLDHCEFKNFSSENQ